MATIKSYTDISQSKKLAEVISPESADYCWGIDDETLHYNNSPYPCAWKNYSCKEYYIPCWSLAALLGVLPDDCCGIDKEDGKYVASYVVSNKGGTYISDNPVDACYEMILKLNELNLL